MQENLEEKVGFSKKLSEDPKAASFDLSLCKSAGWVLFRYSESERESLTVNYIFFVSLLLFYLMGFLFFLFFLHFLDFKNLPKKSRTWSVEYF